MLQADREAGALIAVDWGTSRLRARLLDPTGKEIGRTESDQGIGHVAKGGHADVFEQLVDEWPNTAPAIMAGMVGSRQGWREASYIDCPASLDALADGLLRFDTTAGRPIAIVPGLKVRAAERDGDVIRGEETQVAGLLEAEPGFRGVAILPGTHSKWVAVNDEGIADFQTFMSGELYELLRRQSFLRHSVAGDGDNLSDDADFALAVERTGRYQLPFLASVFSVRARQLLDDVPPQRNLAYLSGLVIGGEIAAAMATGRLEKDTPLRIVGTRSLARAYTTALALLGHSSEAVDGDRMVVAGLAGFARRAGLLPAMAAT